jgi:hypothetical protein
MITYMRTTLVIDDHVLRDAKHRAVEAGLSLSELTTMALRDALRKRALRAQRSPFVMPTYGSSPSRDSPPAEIVELRDDGS